MTGIKQERATRWRPISAIGQIGWLVREDRWRRGYARRPWRGDLDGRYDLHDLAPTAVAASERAPCSMPAVGADGEIRHGRRESLEMDRSSLPRIDNPTISIRSRNGNGRADHDCIPSPGASIIPIRSHTRSRHRLYRAGLGRSSAMLRSVPGVFDLVQLRAARGAPSDPRSGNAPRQVAACCTAIPFAPGDPRRIPLIIGDDVLIGPWRWCTVAPSRIAAPSVLARCHEQIGHRIGRDAGRGRHADRAQGDPLDASSGAVARRDARSGPDAAIMGTRDGRRALCTRTPRRATPPAVESRPSLTCPIARTCAVRTIWSVAKCDCAMEALGAQRLATSDVRL